jgi:hypothetical protein
MIKEQVKKEPIKKSAADYAKEAYRTAISDTLIDASNANVNLRKGRESMKWLAKQARSLRVDHQETMSGQEEERLRNRTQLGIGRMYMFYYDPKHKKKLPYFDRFPCIFIVNIYKDGFLGLNLHYLQPLLRMKLMNELYKIENRYYGAKKKLQLSWDVIKSFANFPLAKACVKRYLYGHLRSKLAYVPYKEWNIAAFLPVARFEKASQAKVWKESREKAYGKK